MRLPAIRTRAMTLRAGGATCVALALMSCGPIGRPPEMTPIGTAEIDAQPILTAERAAIAVPPPQAARYNYQQASLWNTGPSGLLGDRRARNLGDLLTVAIEIDEEAEMRIRYGPVYDDYAARTPRFVPAFGADRRESAG